MSKLQTFIAIREFEYTYLPIRGSLFEVAGIISMMSVK